MTTQNCQPANVKSVEGFPIDLFRAISVLLDPTLERSVATDKAWAIIHSCEDFQPFFDASQRIYAFLDYLHIPRTMYGYAYFHRLFLLLYQEPELLCDIGVLLERVALFFHCTPRSVKSALVRAIEACFDNCPGDRFDRVFDCAVSVFTGVPTIGGFVVSCVRFGFLHADLSS